MTSAKIRIKVGTMELDYEGDPTFLTGGIEALLITMGDLAGRVPVEVASAPTTAKSGTAPAQVGGPTFTTNTIAAHRDAKTGPELLICALARLELVHGKSSSNHAEILAEMKSATSYFNKNMSGNLSSILTGLTTAKRINEVAKDSYALSATERKQVEAKVAEIG